jgi:hypothetical protein
MQILLNRKLMWSWLKGMLVLCIAVQTSAGMAQQAFNWSLDVSVPPGYTYVTLEGSFAGPAGKIVSFNQAGWLSFTAPPAWGGGLATWRANIIDSGDPYRAKPVPHHLKMRWISDVELTYYELDDAALPHTEIERLMQSSNNEERLDDRERLVKGGRIMVGVAPGGVVVVWWADESRQVELARYKAQTARRAQLRDQLGDCQPKSAEGRPLHCPKVSQQVFEQFLYEQVHPELSEKAKAGTLPLGLWDEYRKKYSWEPIVQFTGQTAEMNQRLQSLKIHMLNGEKESISLPMASEANFVREEFSNRAIPRRLLIRWNDGQRDLRADIEMDEQTVMKAFDEAQKSLRFAADKNTSLVCVVNYDPQHNRYRFGFGIMNRQTEVLAGFAPKGSSWGRVP